MLVTSHNKADYAAFVLGFAKVAKVATSKANDFVPLAFAGLIDGDKTVACVLADLLGKDAEAKLGLREVFRTDKGKAVASALPDAMGRAYRQVKAIWEQAERTNEQGEACLLAVKAFIGYLTQEQVAECSELWEAKREALLAQGKAKGTGEASKDLFFDAYVNDIYPIRAANFSQLDKAIKAINSEQAEREAAEQADKLAQEQAEREAAELTPEAIKAQNEANRAELIAAQALCFENAARFLRDMSADFVNAHDDVLTALLAGIGEAFAKRNAAETTAETTAEAA